MRPETAELFNTTLRTGRPTYHPSAPGYTPEAVVTAQAKRVEPLIVGRRVHFECHLLLWQHRGSSKITLNEYERLLTAGYVCLVHADINHTLEVSPDAIILPFFLRLGLPVDSLPIGIMIRVDEDFQDLLLRLAQHQMSEILRSERDIEAEIADRLTTGLSRPGMPPLPSSREAALVAKRIARHPEVNVELSSLMDGTYVAERTVTRQFKAETGRTPSQWRTAYRLAVAAEMISAGTPVAAVGPQVGYTDDAAFRRAFKASFGVTPRSFSRMRGV